RTELQDTVPAVLSLANQYPSLVNLRVGFKANPEFKNLYPTLRKPAWCDFGFSARIPKSRYYGGRTAELTRRWRRMRALGTSARLRLSRHVVNSRELLRLACSPM